MNAKAACWRTITRPNRLFGRPMTGMGHSTELKPGQIGFLEVVDAVTELAR